MNKRDKFGRFIKGNIPWLKGKKGVYSENTLKKMSESNLKHPRRYWLNKRRTSMSGVNHYMWKGGITPLNKKLRKSIKYKRWRETVFERDNYTCQLCGDKGIYLEPNHIIKWSLIMEKNNLKTFEDALLCQELWNIKNGITLCKKCHRFITNHESEWESYFNFNLITRGFIWDKHINDFSVRKECDILRAHLTI